MTAPTVKTCDCGCNYTARKCPKCGLELKWRKADAPPATKPKPGQAHEDALRLQLIDAEFFVWHDFASWFQATIRAGIVQPGFVPQFPFGLACQPPRKYRADFAYPAAHLLCEVEGAAHAAGRAKVAKDTERRGIAAAAGWRMLCVTPAQVKDGSALALLRRALGE